MVHLVQDRAGLLGDDVAEAERVEARPREEPLRKTDVLRPVRPHHVEVALKTSRGENHEIGRESRPLGASQMNALDAAHPPFLDHQAVDFEVPEKADIRVADGVLIDGAHEAEPAAHGLVEAGDAVAGNPERAREPDTHRSEPVVNLVARVRRVVADPGLVRIFSPLEKIARRDLGSVDHSLCFLRRSPHDTESTVRKDGMTSED